MKEKRSAVFLRRRKMFLVLPALVLPFITMAFWALGGGRGSDEKSQTINTGLNVQLPDANLKDDPKADKLAFYKEADSDSLKNEELLRNDPYYKDTSAPIANMLTPTGDSSYHIESHLGALNYSPYNKSADNNEQKIYQKINEINKQINQPESHPVSSSRLPLTPTNDQDISKLQDMMQAINDQQDTDPEMQQLNGALERILDIQHPERVKEKLKEKSLKNKEQVFIITRDVSKNNVGLLNVGKSVPIPKNEFFSLEEDTASDEQNTVEAVVHQTQTLVNGAVVKMRLLDDIYVNGSLIAKGNFVFGIAQLNDERLEITVNSIRNNNSLFPVKLEVYDMDGLPGIYIPGAISREVAKQSADNGLQIMELSSMDPSLKAQAAATGISAAKSLFSKKVKQVKVIVKAGYKVLLRDKNIQQ